MEKFNKKMIIMVILSIFLISCSSSSTYPKNRPEMDTVNFTGQNKNEKNALLKPHLDQVIGELEKRNKGWDSLHVRGYEFDSEREGNYLDESKPIKVIYDEEKFKKLGDKITINRWAHLVVKASEAGKNLMPIVKNEGSLYFVDDTDSPKEYIINNVENQGLLKKYVIDDKEWFSNRGGKIYVIDGNKGSTLTINSSYFEGGYYQEGHNYKEYEKSNVYLGIYENDGVITTDKLIINTYVRNRTIVNFVFNENKIKTPGAKPNPEDFVIYSKNADALAFDSDPVPIGNKVYELKHHREEKKDSFDEKYDGIKDEEILKFYNEIKEQNYFKLNNEINTWKLEEKKNNF